MEGLVFLQGFDVYFLVFARIIMIVFTAPLLSSEAIPAIAKIGLTLMVSIIIFPLVQAQGWKVPDSGLGYIAFLVGEGLIGVTIGSFLQIVYAGFQAAGQFFAVQVGFGASEVYDPLSQEELPVLGQFFNLIAMFLFMVVSGLNRIFLVGIYGSFLSINTLDILNAGETFMMYMVLGLGKLFQEALVISMPIFGTLFIVSIALGLLSKAAPQLNLMSLGFSVNIMVAFGIMVVVLPFLLEAFNGIVDTSFNRLADMFLEVGGQVPVGVTSP